jgi:hypothetical protein
MYHAGVDPAGKPLNVATTDAERMRMHYTLVGPEGKKDREKSGRKPQHRERRR